MSKMKFRTNLSTFSFLLAAIFLILVSGTGRSWGQTQSPAGTWYDSQYQVKLELFTDGTYRLQYPNGAGQGRFSINGNSLCMQDARGGNPVCYNVDRYTGTEMILRDVNGMILNYRRQQAGVVQPAAPKVETGAAKVLAVKNDLTLTTAHLDVGVGLVQFIIGQSVKPGEVLELKAKLIEEFNQAPGEVMQQLTSLEGSLRKIRTLTDPVQIGFARQQLFTALYQGTRQFQEHQKPLMIQVMNRYIKVLAYDAANNLVLTDRDAEGMMRYLAFNSELMGQPIALTPELYRSVAADMTTKFVSMPIEQKRLLCSASLLWQFIEYNWNRLTPAQKQQYKNAFAAKIQPTYRNSGNTQVNQGNQSQYRAPGGTSKDPAQMMRDYNARQQVFNMMNKMSMDSHALSLNIIENIGGTGNYWQVVDY